MVAPRQTEEIISPDNPVHSAPSLKDRFLAWFISSVGYFIIYFIGKTSRLRFHKPPQAAALLSSDRPFLYAFWHRYQLFLAYAHRDQGVNVVISRSKDGELIARAVERLGYRTVRGSSSRGGTAALLEMINCLESGQRVAVTPDGPRGPLGSVQPGVIAAAQKTGVPILPVAWAGARFTALKSWDKFIIPWPFGRCVVGYGTPVSLSPDEDAEAAAEKVRGAIDAAQEDTEKHLWRSSS